jgi:branched-chain amino acid transport system substrate-binding protein
VKLPAESKYPWDYYRQVRRVPAAESIRSLDEGRCEFAKG